MKFRLLAATALVAATSAYAADNMTVKDGTGATKVLAKKDVGSVLYDKNIIVLQSDVTVDAMAQIDGHVDGIESLLTTETNNTSAISGKLPATLGAKTGATSLSVVAANDGFSVQCTSGCSGGTQYNEDAASANGDAGTVALAVRRATPVNSSGADGDYEALQINGGNLWTKDSSLNTAVGTTADATVTAGFSTCSLIACIRAVANAALDTTPASTNLSQIGGNTILTGNGVTGTGSQRVTIASDQTAFSVNVGTVTTLPALAAGTNTIGATFGFAGTATTSFSRPADTTAYTALDWISDSTSAPTSGGFTFSNMCRTSGGSGILTDLYVLSNDTAALAGVVYVFDSAVSGTTFNDNTLESTNTLADADAAKIVAEIPFTLSARTANAAAHVQNLNIGYTCSGTANLRFLVKATGGTLTTASANTYTFRAKYVQTN